MADSLRNSLFFHEQPSAGTRIAQVVGITASAFLAGRTFTSTFSTTPALLLAPAPLLAKQWKKQFDRDHYISPIFAFLGVPVIGFLSWREPASSTPRLLYLTSATLLASIIPYSAALLLPLNQKLEAKAKDLASASLTDASVEAGVAKEETTHQLVDQWATINLGRSVLAGLSAILAAWASVDRMEVVGAGLRFATDADRVR